MNINTGKGGHIPPLPGYIKNIKMKALFISYNQGITERVMHILDHNSIRGFTLFPLTHGRGNNDGEPHMGTHTWPAMNSTIIAIVEDPNKVE